MDDVDLDTLMNVMPGACERLAKGVRDKRGRYSSLVASAAARLKETIAMYEQDQRLKETTTSYEQKQVREAKGQLAETARYRSG